MRGLASGLARTASRVPRPADDVGPHRVSLRWAGDAAASPGAVVPLDLLEQMN
ncbi:hypothetical protein KZX45_10900 [Georgenia sp. EYE_87]|uniref:hypothetical protein n=1 Tax=Georgenia sp. EYE_87 TaxID=2853448 RepID=UPI002002D2E3|nr:hypothetical protein [Georgenia sp. EYE_87]MCK6211052.1 hypothetical protein [Georgenia sp. EYE_87]